MIRSFVTAVLVEGSLLAGFDKASCYVERGCSDFLFFILKIWFIYF